MYDIVIDTNVIVSGFRSLYGASNKLLEIIGSGTKKIRTNISVPAILEYEEVLKRDFNIKYKTEEIDDFLDFFCTISHKHKIYFLWRPLLKDPKDDMFLELAITSKSDYIITYNLDDFKNAKKLGVESITPKEFLQIIGEIK